LSLSPLSMCLKCSINQIDKHLSQLRIVTMLEFADLLKIVLNAPHISAELTS